jgi:hypothetical protein
VTSLVGTRVSSEAVSSHDAAGGATLELPRIRVQDWQKAITAGNDLEWLLMGSSLGALTDSIRECTPTRSEEDVMFVYHSYEAQSLS